MKQTTITHINAGQRADKFVRKWLDNAPLSFIYKLFRKKDVKVNGHWIPIDYVLKHDELLTIYITDSQMEEFKQPRPIIAAAFPHPIIYEDDVCLIVNKPKGLLVHGDASEKRLTLTNQVHAYLANTGFPINQDGYMPAPAHRLDRNTSGLVIFAKTLAAQQALDQLFHDRINIQKEYLALVKGVVESGGEIDLMLYKDAVKGIVRVTKNKALGQHALTIYEPVESFEDYSLLAVTIKTGRTHQIRVHLAAIEHPLVGDRKYGDFNTNDTMLKTFRYEHQFLHAYRLKFNELTGVITHLSHREFSAPLPNQEHQILNFLRTHKE